jgi:hypothetical protein
MIPNPLYEPEAQTASSKNLIIPETLLTQFVSKTQTVVKTNHPFRSVSHLMSVMKNSVHP